MNTAVYTVADEQADLRLDKFLAEESEELSRSYIQKIIEDGGVLVNETPVRKAGRRLKENDRVSIEVPESVIPEIKPENIELDVVYEDSDVIVVNKPKGMVVHPAPGHYTGTLVNALMFHCEDLSGINGVLRPGIVHRIDKDTSGLLVCAKNNFAHSFLASQFKEHSAGRSYHAIACGKFKEPGGCVDKPIGRRSNDRKLMGINEKNGRRAVTRYKVLKEFDKYTYIECRLETGRTHQIRVHMAYINHPLLGDGTYGGKNAQFKLNGNIIEGQCLHAKTLGFIHPSSGEYMEFDSPLPQYFKDLLEKLSQAQ